MAIDQIQRKLAAILVADVAGYSRLMGTDEEATLSTLNSHRREHIDPCIARHRGRIVKTTGDGFLAEFASAVNALRCALAVQTGMAERNAEVGVDRRLEFRIGINVGDIVDQDGDIFGDDVNIAARLEGIAEPGGICVSARVQEDTAGKTGIAFEDLGEQTLKNVARPVRAFRVKIDRASVTGAAGPDPLREDPALPDRPLIAVLPFQNMGADPGQDYFADGVVEDIITALSRFKSFAVISRNTSFVYKGRAVDVRQVARELGVRYVLEGSVRKAGNRLRITAQLIDGKTGAQRWANKFDGEVEDIFDVQDKITESVVVVIEPQIRQAEIERTIRKRPESLDAYDLLLRALPKYLSMSPEDNAEAYDFCTRAVLLEPNYSVALTYAAEMLQFRHDMGWPPLTADDRTMCLDLTRRALANANGDAEVIAYGGWTLANVGREYDRGLRLTRIAFDANPNNLVVLSCAGVTHLHCGSIEDSLAFSQRAIRLSPGDPHRHFALTATAHAHLALGNYTEALQWAEQALAVKPTYNAVYWMLIAANVKLDRIDEARRWFASFRALAPDVTIASIRVGQPDRNPSVMAAILEGLRVVGLDEG